MFPHAIKLDRPRPAKKNLVHRRAWMSPDDESKNLQNFLK